MIANKPMMKISKGKLRFHVLLKCGRFFRWLEEHNGSRFSRLVFTICSGLWEKVTPSAVYRIVSIADYSKKGSVEINSIKTFRIGYAANAVSVGRGQKQHLKPVSMPDLNLYGLKDVTIHYGSDFIVDKKKHIVINDYCATKNDDNKGYEDNWTYWQGGKCTILRKGKKISSLEAGIMLTAKYSFNYYHNIYENLIRLCVLSECNELIPHNIPLLVDEVIFEVPSFSRVFDILSKHLHRDIIVVNKNSELYIKSLYFFSAVNNLVPNHVDDTKGHMEDYVFDKYYTLKMRTALLSHCDESKNYPRRFFITRKKAVHRHFNEKELFDILVPYGFSIIAPEDYTIEQQMAIFNNAEIIVSNSGAALTNLLFVSPSCVVFCFYRNADYIAPVFTAPVVFNNAHMYYFQSKEDKGMISAHADFSIDVNDFRQFVKDCIEPITCQS